MSRDLMPLPKYQWGLLTCCHIWFGALNMWVHQNLWINNYLCLLYSSYKVNQNFYATFLERDIFGPHWLPLYPQKQLRDSSNIFFYFAQKKESQTGLEWYDSIFFAFKCKTCNMKHCYITQQSQQVNIWYISIWSESMIEEDDNQNYIL